jgi:hypothetical protein
MPITSSPGIADKFTPSAAKQTVMAGHDELRQMAQAVR